MLIGGSYVAILSFEFTFVQQYFSQTLSILIPTIAGGIALIGPYEALKHQIKTQDLQAQADFEAAVAPLPQTLDDIDIFILEQLEFIIKIPTSAFPIIRHKQQISIENVKVLQEIIRARPRSNTSQALRILLQYIQVASARSEELDSEFAAGQAYSDWHTAYTISLKFWELSRGADDVDTNIDTNDFKYRLPRSIALKNHATSINICIAEHAKFHCEQSAKRFSGLKLTDLSRY